MLRKEGYCSNSLGLSNDMTFASWEKDLVYFEAMQAKLHRLQAELENGD